MVRNETRAPIAFTVELDFGTDFADIISVKEHDFALGDPLHAPDLPPPAEAHFDDDGSRIVLAEGDGRGGRTQVLLSRAGEGRGGVVRFPVGLAPHGSWDVRVDVAVSLDGEVEQPETVERQFGTERARVRDSLSAWSLRLPRLSTNWDELRLAFGQSVADLASLRLRAGAGTGLLPAAGMPWFMTVFGRDTIITSLQSMLLGPELAVSALSALAELQADEDDPSVDAEPGKILHELRSGRAAEKWFARYYGTADATPLYLVLLSEVWRWTGDRDLVERLREPCPRRAPLDRRVRRPRRRRLRRVRATLGPRAREPVVEGLRRLAALPRRPPRGDADRARGGAGVRLRRQAPARRGRARRVGRRAARGAAGRRGGRAGRALRRGLLGPGPRRVLRAGARSRQAPGGRALLEHRPPPLERHRPRGPTRPDRRRAHAPRALVGMGDPDDVEVRRRVQPAQLPQRDGLAARHGARRVGSRPLRLLGTRAPDHPRAARGRAAPRLVAPGGVRRLRPLRDALPDRLPDGRATAGLGSRDAAPPAPAGARPGARPSRRAGSASFPAPCRSTGSTSPSPGCARSDDPGT